MANSRILLVDDDDDYLGLMKEYFEKRNFSVICESSHRAADILQHFNDENNSIDIMIIDRRLRDSNDPLDNTGVILAQSIAKDIPRIIHTVEAPSIEDLLSLVGDRTVAGVVLKSPQISEGLDKLFSKVTSALNWKTSSSTRESLYSEYKDLRLKSTFVFALRYVVAIGGFVIILISVVSGLQNPTIIAALGAIVGALATYSARFTADWSDSMTSQQNAARDKYLEYDKMVMEHKLATSHELSSG